MLKITSILSALTLFLAACSAPAVEVVSTSTVPAPPTERLAAETRVNSAEAASSVTPEPEAYPAFSLEAPASPTPAEYPSGYDTAGPSATPAPEEVTAASNDVYIPFSGTAPDNSTPTPEPAPTVDFAAVRAELEANGEELAFVKAGFHVTLPENSEVLDEWMTRLDEAGVPFFLKTVDNAEPLFKAQELMRESGVPHVLVYRATGSVPHYELPAADAARHHWAMHRDLFPPELDPSLVWIETLNEPDRTKSEWLAQFALETAKLAMADGFRWAAFGWASGEPEPEHWRGPAMQEFLRLAGNNPEQLAIALHEYSYLEDDIGHEYPYKVGRFQALFEAVDSLGIPRPTVLITEWGWEYNDVPPPAEAIEDIKWASKLYAAFPQVKGAAIWNVGVGCCFDDVSEQTQELIGPLTELSLHKYYGVPLEQQAVDPARFQP